MEPAVILAHLLVLWCIFGEPTCGKYLYRKLERNVGTDPSARGRFYGDEQESGAIESRAAEAE